MAQLRLRTLEELESHLWESANILRGPVDAADFKTYIFPLLFFKRISDVYDDEFNAALADSNGDREYAAFPESHRASKSPKAATGATYEPRLRTLDRRYSTP